MKLSIARRIETVLEDIRCGFRSIRQAPRFSAILILTLALGIGANTAIFGVVYAALLRTPPYPHGERLVELSEAAAGQNIPVSWINFQHWLHENRTFEDIAGFENADLTLTGHGDALVAHAGVVSADFFRLTGWHPLLGRLFDAADDRPGAAPAVLLTAEFWSKTLQSDPRMLGTALTLDGKAYQIIGILPPGLRFFTQPVDFYLPAGPRDGNTENRADHGAMLLLALLKPGVTPTAARADLDAIMHRLSIADPGPESAHRSATVWLTGFGADQARPALRILMAAVGLVLLIACANVATLLLVRSAARVREMAIRSAIGAGRSRLARLLLAESLVLAAFGGIVGVLLAGACLRALVLIGPPSIPRLWDASLNLPVLCFTAAVTLLTGLLAGLAPVFNSTKLDLTSALKEGSSTSSGGRRGHSLRGALVVSEIALTLLLSFACGLLLRSLILAQNSYPGFTPAGVLALELQLPPARYPNDNAIRQFYARLLDNLRQTPGVADIGMVNCPPSAACARGWYSIADLPAPARSDVPLSFLSSVDPGCFHTMRIRLLAGRDFATGDRPGSPQVAIVNETLARRWFPSAPQRAVGHPIKLGGPYMDGPTLRIVGVVGSVSQDSLDSPPFAEIHVPSAQNASPSMVVMLRAAGDPARLIPQVRRQLALLDSGVPIQSIRPFEQWMAATLDRRRFSTLLLGIFAALALSLCGVGIYGILNHWVQSRRKEIAIRLALGAPLTAIFRWVGGHALRLVAAGLALGAFGCWAAAQSLQSLLFAVSAGNPVLLLAAAAPVITIAALAALVPLYRALRIEAIRNLRDV